MRKKYIFFDIDNTITADNGKVLPSTFKTIKELRKNGHFIALATGRAHYKAKPFAEGIGINNMVCNDGGGYCIDGKVIEIAPLNRIKCIEICNEAFHKKLGIGISINDSADLYCKDNIFEIRGQRDGLTNYVIDKSLIFENIKEFYKLFIALTIKEEYLLTNKDALGYLRCSSRYIMYQTNDKFLGIKKLMTYLDAPIDDVVVFGDGKNDKGMFLEAPISIAMGNAIDKLKDIATFITKSNEDDGIEYACKYFGWID